MKTTTNNSIIFLIPLLLHRLNNPIPFRLVPPSLYVEVYITKLILLVMIDINQGINIS